MALTTSYGFLTEGSEFTINGVTGNSQYDPSITALNNGGFFASYSHVFSSTDVDVLGRAFSNTGVPGFDVGIATAGSSIDEYDSSLTTLTNGNVVAAYTDEEVNGGPSDVNFVILSPTGGLVRGETPVSLNTTKADYTPSVTALAGGGFAVAWTHAFGSGDDDVYLRTFDAAGNAVSGEIPVASGINYELQPAVAGLSNGNVVAVWSEETFDGSGVYDLKGEIYSATGALVRDEFVIDSFSNSQLEPSVVALPSGGFAVGFTDYFSTPSEVSLKTFTNNGDPSFTFFDQSNAPNFAADPSLTVLDNGFLAVTWTEEFSSSDWDIRARILDPQTGTFVTDRLTIEFDGGLQYSSAVAGLDAGRFVTAWTDSVTSEDGSGSAVRAQINELTRTITSDGASETLTGDALRDILLGNGGNDLLKGLGAKDTLDGGTGVDTASYSEKTSAVVATLNGATNATVSVGGVAEDTIRNIENLHGGTANDTLTGDGLANLLDGSSGNDVLKGQGGTDTLKGATGADDLYAGVDNVRDTFLIAGKNNSGTTSTTWDQLFEFDRSLSSTDTSSDKIDLRPLDADPAAGDQAFRFVTSFTTPTSTQSDGQVRVVDAGANVNVQIDFNGDNTLDMILQVMNIDTLTSRDFLL